MSLPRRGCVDGAVRVFYFVAVMRGLSRRLPAGFSTALLALVVLLLAGQLVLGQTTAPASAPTTAAADSSAAPKTPGQYYGAWVLLPPLLTIVLAIWWRQVIPALGVGTLVAAYMVVWSAPGAGVGDRIIGGLTLAVEGFLIGALAETDRIKIILFTLAIGGMVGIIAANGGTAAIVGSVARWASNRRRGQIATWFAGLIVFFDDYANAMIVGPSMRPVCDRLKISRAKLAYLVDSTAAPVSSIALIGTWIGAEIGYIHDGLKVIAEHPPAFLAEVPLDAAFAYGAFISSIPYRFYPILALVMVLLVGLLGRDFGPMRRAESNPTLPDADDVPGGFRETAKTGKGWYAGVPVLVLVFGTLSLLLLTGWQAVQGRDGNPAGLDLIQRVVSQGNSYNSVLYGALAAAFVAGVISLATRTLTLGRTVDSATAVMSRMLPTLMVLVLAWALSGAMKALELGDVAGGLLQGADFDARWLPLLVFASACVVSFATGTSWGTMAILCPVTVQVAARLIDAGLGDQLAAEQAFPLFYASIGGVLAGAIFGDHCSPISDTTVLSSLASECKLEQHVWTQMPYALTVAAVSVLTGDVLCRYLEVSPWVSLLAGSFALLVILLVVGRKPQPVREEP